MIQLFFELVNKAKDMKESFSVKRICMLFEVEYLITEARQM